MSKIIAFLFLVLFSISVGNNEKKKEKKEDSEKTVRDNIRKSLKEILTARYCEKTNEAIVNKSTVYCSFTK